MTKRMQESRTSDDAVKITRKKGISLNELVSIFYFLFYFFFEKDRRIETFHIRKYHKHHRKGRRNNLLFHKKEPLIKNKNAESEMLEQRFFTLKSITNIAEEKTGNVEPLVPMACFDIAEVCEIINAIIFWLTF